MLASQPGRYVSESSGVLRCRSILYCVVFLLLAFLHDPVISEEAQCTKSTLRDHLRKSFKVMKLGRTRNIRSCINLCCSRRNCDLALLRKTRCYGISCSHHDLCRSILNGLREKRHEISKRSVDDTEDIQSDFSHHPKHHGFCRHRRVVPHHIFLEGGRGVSKFHKLATDVSSSRECNQHCCQRADCSLAFIMRDKCYGVICPDDGDCESGEGKRVPVHLEIALLERRGSFGEASRVVDSDVDKKPSLSERRHHHHHHHHHHDDPAEDDTSYNQEHETQLPQKHHLHDGSTIPLHHHHHHHHHVHKSTYNPGVRESDSQSSSQESDHKRRHVKTHRHQNSEEREDSNQDNENDNSYKHREGEHHRHHHRKMNMEHEKINRMYHHRNMEHGTNHDSNERDDTIEEQSKSHRHRGHHKHVKMNSDMKYDNEDKDSDISSRHSIRKRKHNRQDKMDSFESPEDDRGRDAPLKKKHRKQERHKSGGNSEGNDDEEEQSGTHRRKKSRPPKHHHLDEVNHKHEEKSMNSEDIMEFGDKDNDDDENANGENFPRKHDKVDHENESSENEDFEHEQRKEDQDKDMNKDEDGSEGTFTKNKNRHEDSHETSQEKTDYKKHHQTGRESLSSESKMRNNEMQDGSEDDDEESPKEHKTRGEEKEDYYDEEMNDEDGHFGSGENEEERSKIEHEKDSNEGRDDNMNDDEMENRKNINHRKKEKGRVVDYNHNHDHDEDDIQAQTNEYHHHHHHHDDNVQDQNDDNTKHDKKDEKEQHHHHHHHHHNIHEDNAQEHNEKITDHYKKEKQEMNSDPDMNEMKTTDNEMSGNKINEHHHHHHHHQKKTIKEHQERTTIKNQHKDNYRQNENEYQEYSGSGDDSDNENIMSQNYAHRVYEQNHNHNHEDRSDDRSDFRDNDEDKNFKSSKKKAKDYNPSKGENYESSKKEKKSEDVFKNKKPNSREKEKMDKIEDNDNSEDKEGERNTIHNEEADRSEPKSKIHVHHEHDKDDDEHDSKEKIASKEKISSDEENKIEKNKIKESISKKGNGKTSKHELDNDEINDNDSEEDSKKNSNFKNKDDESDSITDENQSSEEHKDHNKAGNEQRHYKKEREGHLHKEHRKNYDNSERKNTEHIQGERKYNEHHVEKETKYNSDVKDSQQKESKERKGKQEFVKEDSENTEPRNQKQGGPLEVNHDHKNAKHHQKKMKSSNGKIEDIKSNVDNRMKHESNKNQRSKADNNDSNGHTDDRDSDDSEDSNDDAKQNHEYNSKVSTHDEHTHNKQEKHPTEKSHGYFESENENDDNDQKNRESQTDGVGEAGSKNNNHKKSDRKDNGNERGDLSKDSSESKSNEMKNKNSHATTSEHVDHKDSEDNEKEKESKNEDHKENLSKNEDHKESKSNENNRKDDEISSDHVDRKESYGDHKSKNSGRDKGNSENDEGKDESTNKNRKENESSKTEDADGIRRDHVDHGTSSSVEKKYAGSKHHTKANKDENSSETIEENGMQHSGRKNDYKNHENIEEKHEVSSNGISGSKHHTKANKDENSSETTDENGMEHSGRKNDYKNHENIEEKHEVSSNGISGSKHHTKANKDENSSETTDENGMEHSGRKNGYKNRENIEEKQHEISRNKIGMTKDNRTSHDKENTIIPFKHEETTEHLNKNTASEGTNSEIQKNGTTGNKHKNFMHNKLDNKFENTHEPSEVENGFNKDETGSSKKLTKQDEHEIRNNTYDNKEKNEPLESEEKRITGKHKKRKEKVAIQKVTTEDGSTKTNVNEHSKMNQDLTNNPPPRIDDNTNANNTQSAIEKQNDKHHRKNTGENVPGEIIDIVDNNEQDKSNTGYPQHKPFLYHSLNELKEIKSNNGQKKKMERISPEVNHEHDIMKSNQNYTEATKPKETEEGSEEDKTRFFNQETNEWKESFKGDQVDESGKYFNQRTRGWSVNQPKTNTDYFHNLTSQWNLENKTKPSDFGKYFNQRTKTWLGNKVGHAYRKNLGDTTGRVKEKDSNTLHINGSMKGNKVQSSRKKILSSTNNNHKKHKQNITVYKPVQKHKLQSTIPKDEEGKSSQVIHNNTKIREQFNLSKTSGTVIPTKVKQKDTKVKSASHKAKDSETAEEKVKNEILKLIGEAPAKTTSSHKKAKNIVHRLINKPLESSVNVSTHIDNISPRKPENIPQPRTIPTSPENITNALPQHQGKPYKPRIVGDNKILVGKFPHVPRKKKVLKTSKSTTKVKSKEEFDAKRPHGTKMNSLPPKSKQKNRINSTRKQKIGPLLKQPQRKPIRPTQPLAIPIKHHIKFPRIRKKPVNSINRVRPTSQPGVHTWKGTPTVSSIGKYDYQNWNKQNVFDNEWNNAKWNSYYNTYGSNSILQTPTTKPTLSWNSMPWNSNSNQQGNIIHGYQNGGTEGRGQGITPRIAPINTGRNANKNSQINRVHNYPNGGIEGKFRGMRPTLAPVNRNKQFPFTFDGTSKSGKGHQIGGMGNTPRVLGPTLAPPYRQRGSSLNRNGGLNHGGKDQSGGHRIPVLTPTLAPPYRLGGFPLTKNGDRTNRRDYWNQNFKSPFGRKGPPVGSHPSGTETKNGDMTNTRKDFWNQNIKTPSEVGRNTLDKTAPRSHVYYSENKQRVSNLTQNHVMKPPRKPSSSQLTGPRTFVHPLGNVTSQIPTKNAPDQPASIRNNYWKQNKVLSSGKMNSSQVQHISKTIPILRRPTLPPQLTRKPNQWTKTRTTSRIHHPFKINKIESLHGETKDRLHPNVPKGCFPGEIMSEMTLENGLDAGNYTNLGRTELMDSCISKCCEIKSCEVAVQMDNVCFGLKCHSKESCKIKTTLGKSSHHKLCFLSRKKKERQNIFDFDNDILGEQDVCRQEQAVGLNWKTTNAGTFDEIPCPKKAKGLAKRKCSIESHWLLPDFSSCVSNAYEELYQRAKRLVYGEDSSSLLQSLVLVTTRTIDNSLIFGGDLKKTTEIMTAIVQEQGARQDGGISLKNVKNYLITCSNLLDDSNKQEWRNIQNDARGSADILRDSQTYALIASSKLPETRTNLTYVTNNIVVQMSYQEKGSNDKIFPDYTNTDVALWDGEKDNIRLPKSVFSIGNIKTVTFSYKTLPALLPMDSNQHFRHSEPNSKILATIAEPRIQDKITPAITITLHHLKQNRLNPKCVFWDFNLNPVHGGAWSTEGCWLESSTKERTICRCDHLANFAVLMNVLDSGSMQASAKDERYSKEMAAMWICIPVLVVLVIAALYIASTWSRGPRRRTLSERSSLLRSSVTTDEVRYDYSSTPSHNLEGTSPPKLKELEWQNEFNKDVESLKDIGLTFDSSNQRMRGGQEMEHDSGIESNDHDDSHCDLSLSQENLEIREEQFQGYLEDIHHTESILDSGITSPTHSHTNFIQEKQTIHLDVERRIFPTNLRRCCGQEDLSSPKR